MFFTLRLKAWKDEICFHSLNNDAQKRFVPDNRKAIEWQLISHEKKTLHVANFEPAGMRATALESLYLMTIAEE